MEVKKISIIALVVFVFLISKYSIKDITDFFNYLGKAIYPANFKIGIALIILSLLIILFFNEIKLFLQRVKRR